MANHDSTTPTRKELINAMLPFAVPDTRIGVRQFVGDFGMYCVGMGLAIFGTNMALRLLGSVLVALRMGALYTLAHDAAHNSLTASRRLNVLLGSVGYLLTLHNYRIRCYDHLVLGHHPSLNGPQPDVYLPMSWHAYQAAPAWRRAWERFVRAPNLISFGVWGIVTRWLGAEVWPNKGMSPARRAEAWAYAALIVGYVASISAFLAFRREGDGAAFAVDLVLVFGIPFFIFQALQAVILYFSHTHPLIPWFGPGDSRIKTHGAEIMTVRIRMPKFLAALIHYINEHPAHHVLQTIPNYRLLAAQDKLDEIIGDRAVSVKIYPSELAAIMRRCQVYDYELHCWRSFDGRVTSARNVQDQPWSNELRQAA